MASSSTLEALGQSAMGQILSRQRKQHLSDDEMSKLTARVTASCERFDKSGKGRLTVDEFYNVLKLQNKLECSKEELRELFEDLEADRDGRVAIGEFMTQPIISKHVFDSMDLNKDGFVSKGELKMARKDLTKKELGDIVKYIDRNSDGKLSFEEVKVLSKKYHDK